MKYKGILRRIELMNCTIGKGLNLYLNSLSYYIKNVKIYFESFYNSTKLGQIKKD